MTRRLALLVATLVAVSGCGPSPGAVKPGGSSPRKASVSSADDQASPTPRPPLVAGKPVLPEGVLTRVVAQTGAPTQLTGKVKLISDHGAALISNNSGSVIANNGGGLISDGGGGLIANNGGGLVTKAKLRLLQAAQQEATLVDATVYVHDAKGQALVDGDGKPLAAVSDGQGGYAIAAVLPPENLVLRVRLWHGGELAAILPKAEPGAREVAIDTAATLGATYVLEQFVKGDQATFDKLPASEAARLTRELEAARGKLGKTPGYQVAELVALTDALRTQAPAVDQTLREIKALLLGQANLGGGRQATAVPLADPRATVPDGQGFYVSEGALGRIRHVAADGTITTYADQLHGKIKANFWGAIDMTRGSDGSLYVLSAKTFGVSRLKPDGTVEDLAGTGRPGHGEVGRPGLEVAMRPWTIWMDPDQTIWLGEESHEDNPPRILTLGADGVVREPAPAAWGTGRVVGLARAGDGALYALITAAGGADGLWRLAPGTTTWTRLATPVKALKQSDLAPAADGGLILTEADHGLLVHVALDGTRKVLFDAAQGSPLKRPTDVWVLPDGRIRVIDGASIQVFEIAKDGAITAVAGTGAQAGNAEGGDAIALGGPFAAAYSPAGQLHIAETGAHSISRWDGQNLTTLAGGVLGFGGDGEAAGTARFDTPVGIAFKGDELLVVDQGNGRLRAVSPDGKIRTVATGVSSGAHVAVGADGSIYWSELDANRVMRLAPGASEATALTTGGKGSAGDGEAALQAKLNAPVGLAFGPDGKLYLADSANMRVRRIADPAGASPTMEAFAGLDGAAAFARLAEPAAGPRPAAEAAFAMPSALCFDQAGNLYVAEFGTLSLPLLAGLSEGVRDLPLALLPKVAARVHKITPGGVVSVVAGPGGKFFADAEAGDALVLPTGLTIDPQGRLVIVDAGANLVRFIPAGAY